MVAAIFSVGAHTTKTGAGIAALAVAGVTHAMRTCRARPLSPAAGRRAGFQEKGAPSAAAKRAGAVGAAGVAGAVAAAIHENLTIAGLGSH